MKRMAIAVVLLAALLGASAAAAAPVVPGSRTVLRTLSAADVVPADWAGVWSIADTIYSCLGEVQQTTSGSDTLCAGQEISQESPDPSIQFTCTSSITANTFQIHCAGSMPVMPDCQADFTLDGTGTFSGDSFFSVMTMTTTFSGTGEGCDLFPPSCTQINAHGTRTGPAPIAFCQTPTHAGTWGELKSIYR